MLTLNNNVCIVHMIDISVVSLLIIVIALCYLVHLTRTLCTLDIILLKLEIFYRNGDSGDTTCICEMTSEL